MYKYIIKNVGLLDKLTTSGRRALKNPLPALLSLVLSEESEVEVHADEPSPSPFCQGNQRREIEDHIGMRDTDHYPENHSLHDLDGVLSTFSSALSLGI